MLSVRKLEVFYGPIRAVRGIDLDVQAGEIVALIGANGAGKTSTLRAIAGLLPFRGEIAYQGRTLIPNQAERNLRAGLSLVPEGRGMLGRMSVEDNLRMGTYARSDHAVAAADIERMFERFPILKERRAAMANLLSGGEQQMLAIARALLSRPRLLLLDEPSLGLAPKMTEFVFGTIADLRREGLTVLLVEQKARQALKFANRAYLMETGCVTASGPAAELAAGSLISEAFLGKAPATASGAP
jgi:branched-chain amino acid transport system ATP-binding protein